jgi:hypothetical protein
MTFFDGRDLLYRVQKFRARTRRADSNKCNDSQSERSSINLYGPSPYDAFSFEPPQALMHRRGRQFYQSSKILKAAGGILLQRLKQDEIFSVEVHCKLQNDVIAEENSAIYQE